MERKAASVREAQESLGISRSKVYQLIRSGELYSIRLGRRILIPLNAIEQLLKMPTK